MSLEIALVAQPHCAYVGDEIVLWLCVKQSAEASGRVSLVLPPIIDILAIESDQDPHVAKRVRHLGLDEFSHEFRWDGIAGTTATYRVRVLVASSTSLAFQLFVRARRLTLDSERPLLLDCWAEIHEPDGSQFYQDHTCLSIRIASQYVGYLPSLYRQTNNALLGRFLMGLESIWQPIEQSIETVESQLNAMLAPVELLPWLAEWGNEANSADWPLDRRRRLLSHLPWLLRVRGTRAALAQRVKDYTGFEPKIEEKRVSQLQFGGDTLLGGKFILGNSAIANTFIVQATIPKSWAYEIERHRTALQQIIETEKPAFAIGVLDERFLFADGDGF